MPMRFAGWQRPTSSRSYRRRANRFLGYPATVRGAEQVLEAREKSRGDVYGPQITITMINVMADGDLVAAIFSMRTVTFGNAPYENDYVFLFRFEDGKICVSIMKLV
jgi:ketosteroid isomerase-like protein